MLADPSLLVGLVTDQHGEPLIPTHANKGQRRYRYYVSKPLQIDGASHTGDGLRVPAADLEQIVTDRLLRLLRQPAEVLNATSGVITDGSAQRQVLERATQLAATWEHHSAAEHRARLRVLVSRIVVYPDKVELHLSSTDLADLLCPGSVTVPHDPSEPTSTILTMPVQLRRWQKEVRLLVQGPSGGTEPNPALLRLIVRAHTLWAALLDEDLTITALAERERVTSSYVTRLVRLVCLAPDIKAAIIDGHQPAGLTADRLMLDSRLPLAWAQQRTALGFA